MMSNGPLHARLKSSRSLPRLMNRRHLFRKILISLLKRFNLPKSSGMHSQPRLQHMKSFYLRSEKMELISLTLISHLLISQSLILLRGYLSIELHIGVDQETSCTQIQDLDSSNHKYLRKVLNQVTSFKVN